MKRCQLGMRIIQILEMIEMIMDGVEPAFISEVLTLKFKFVILVSRCAKKHIRKQKNVKSKKINIF